MSATAPFSPQPAPAHPHPALRATFSHPGEGKRRRALYQSSADRRHDGVAILQHLCIAEAQHRETVSLDLLGPSLVVFAFPTMLPAIDLDDQLRSMQRKSTV